MLKQGRTIGILGGGQLGRMLALAAATLGMRSHSYAPEADSPAFDVSAAHTLAGYEDTEALRAFAGKVDVITYEFENVPTLTLDHLEKTRPSPPVRPGRKALATTQDRLLEKEFIAACGLRTAPFAAVDDLAMLEAALEKLGAPAILKTRRFGYDGKGQVKITAPGKAKAAFEAIGGQSAILEGFVPFSREISVIVARGLDGATAVYDVCENDHRNHILAHTRVPAHVSPAAAEVAQKAALSLATALDYVGVMTVEMFVVEQDGAERIVVNEIAPRVHNSGHWTIEGAETSQFEQHIRAVMGLPLGSTKRRGVIDMENLLGEDMHKLDALLVEPGAHLHLYGKTQARKGRKMGHVTRVTRE